LRQPSGERKGGMIISRYTGNLCIPSFRRVWLLPLVLFALLAGSILVTPSPVSADGGMVVIGPQEITLWEQGQKAIVGWNGTEEVLIISVDVESSASASALRIVPLPSNPSKVEQGSTESFIKLAEVMNNKIRQLRWSPSVGRNSGTLGGDGEVTLPPVQVTFHQEMGAHDVTVVRVEDVDAFSGWIEDFSVNNGLGPTEVSPVFKGTIENYLSRDIRYFVFDLIDAGTTVRSVEPLVYRFTSDSVYYPLEITATSDIGQTYSEVNLFLITKGAVGEEAVKQARFWPWAGFDIPIALTQGDLESVSPELADLFQSDPFVVNARAWGPLWHLDEDLVIHQDSITSVPLVERLLSRHYGFLSVVYFLHGGIPAGDWVFIGLFIVLMVLFIAFPMRLLLGRWLHSPPIYRAAAYLLSGAITLVFLFSVPATVNLWLVPIVIVLSLVLMLRPVEILIR
jgi:hypothetical protein